MNKLFLFIVLLINVIGTSAQQVDWVVSNPVNYNMNPGLVFQTLETSPNGNIICSRLDSSRVAFNNNVYGRTIIENIDATGHVNWSFILTDSVVVNHILTDANNRIYIGGRFLGTAVLNGTDTMFNSSTIDFNEDEFILKLSPGGNLLWKKNLGSFLQWQKLTALTCDQQNNLWFCTSDFMDGRMFKTNNFGDVVDSLIIKNAKWVSGISFDSYGAVYICGAVENGIMEISGSQFNVPDSYMMYIARLDSNFGVNWIYFAHDITFQYPQLVSDGLGGAMMAGNFYDSLNWGNAGFDVPQWGSDFFLVRVDSTGSFRWGRSMPFTPTITGRFTIGTPGKFIETDPANNVLLLGTLNGSVDWGNGIYHSGNPGAEKIHVVSFDINNNALWQKTGGGQGNYPTAISVSNQNEIYFTSAVTDTCIFDSIMVNAGNNLAAIVVKLFPGSVGVEEINNNVISVYPNPASSYLSLPKEWEGKLVSVYDMQYELIKSIRFSGSLFTTDDLKNGNYIIRCESQYSRLTILKN